MIKRITQDKANPNRLDINELLCNPPKLEISKENAELQSRLDEIDLMLEEKLSLNSLTKLWTVCAMSLQKHFQKGLETHFLHYLNS